MATIDQVLAVENGDLAADERLLATLRRIRAKRKKVAKVYRPQPDTGFPELFVDVPDPWPHVDLAPLYDVHLGHRKHLDQMFTKHVAWMLGNPYLLTFDGGDLIENANKFSVGSGVYEQDFTPDNQIVGALSVTTRLWHKMLFKLPGNHEHRTMKDMGIDIGRWIAVMEEVPYFGDFCFCTIRFRGNNFRLAAHHGVGAATTAGAQRMAARKMLPWARADIIWTGHQHTPLIDPIYQTDYDQRTGRIFERDGIVVISPSYLAYFETYAARKMYPPGIPGLHLLTLQADGRIDANVHARGRRL